MSELLLHARVWNVSSERWFIVALWFIRSIAERSNSPGPFMFQKGGILRKTSCQESNPNVMCKHMQVLLIYRNPVAKTKKEISKGEAIFWFGCCGWELNESHWRCVVGWLDDSLSLTLWQQWSENEAANNKRQACILPKAWSFICSVHRRQQSLLKIR